MDDGQKLALEHGALFSEINCTEEYKIVKTVSLFFVPSLECPVLLQSHLCLSYAGVPLCHQQNDQGQTQGGSREVTLSQTLFK